jgi:hypothetical protein
MSAPRQPLLVFIVHNRGLEASSTFPHNPNILLKVLLFFAMDTPPTASSLYGPGTFICWLCSLVSVLISWRFNQHSKTHDTITNDLLVTLTLPAIAAVHSLLVFFFSEGKDQTITMEATSTVCVWYMGVGCLLVLLAVINRSPKRLLCTLAVHVLCFEHFFFLHIVNLRDYPLETQRAKPLLAWLSWSHSLSIPFVMQAALYDRNWQWVSWHKNQHFCLITVWFTIALAFGLLLHSLHSTFAEYPDVLRAEVRPWLARLSLPRSGIAITELDQIVAIVAGVLTVLITVKEAITSRNMSPWASYEVWRAKCEALLKDGVLASDEASQLKDRLELLSQREEEILDAPGSTDAWKRMVHIQEKRGLERIAELRSQALPLYATSYSWKKDPWYDIGRLWFYYQV